MKINQRQIIEELQIDLYRNIDLFVEKCKDPKLFDLGSSPLFGITKDFQRLAVKVNDFNLESKFIKTDPIEDAYTQLCNKLLELPKMADLFQEHLKRAKVLESEYNKLMKNWNSFSKEDKSEFVDEKMEDYHRALKFIQDPRREAFYNGLATEIAELLNTYCQNCLSNNNAIKSLQVKSKYSNSESGIIESFCKELILKGYFDQENADKFQKMLVEGQLPSRIDWQKKPAEICRLITIMNSKDIFDQRPNWKTFEETFYFNGKVCSNLRTTATSKPSDRETEEIVKHCFKLK